MASNGTSNGSNGINVSGWKHYNEGTFLFTVSLSLRLGIWLCRADRFLAPSSPSP